jgi:hypothetical protein
MPYQKTTVKYKLTLYLESDFDTDQITAQAKILHFKDIDPDRIYYNSRTNGGLDIITNADYRAKKLNKVEREVDIISVEHFYQTHTVLGYKFMNVGYEDDIKLKIDHTNKYNYDNKFSFDSEGFLKIKKIDDSYYTMVGGAYHPIVGVS